MGARGRRRQEARRESFKIFVTRTGADGVLIGLFELFETFGGAKVLPCGVSVMDRVRVRRRRRGIGLVPMVVAAAVGLGAAGATVAGAQTTGPFDVVSTTKVGPSPGRVVFGYGAAWTLNGNGSVSRVDATSGAVKTTTIGPNPRDIRAGYNRIWVLSSTKSEASIVTLNTAGAKVGKTITISLGSTVNLGNGQPNGANTLGVGSNKVWVAGVRTWQKLASIDPSSAKVVVTTWPIPQAFTAADSALWMVTPNQADIQKRSPSNLAIQKSLPVSAATGGVAGPLALTYGANLLWLSQSTPNDLGQINQVSPTGGLVKGAVSSGLTVTLTCTAVGEGAVWATQLPNALDGTPALLFRLSQTNLATLASGTLPAGANPGAVRCVTVGGGLVWVTDGVGSLYKIQP